MKYLASVFTILFVFTTIIGCGNEIDEKTKEYSKIIGRIEQFVSSNKRTPNDQEFYEIIKQLGYQPSENCPCYTKVSDSEYELYFGLDLGTSIIYNSKTKKWHKEG